MMHVAGVVRETGTRRPIALARVALQVGETRVSTSTDDAGAFAWRTDRDHRGDTLFVQVERTGFQPAEARRSIDGDELTVDFELRRLGTSGSLQVDVRDQDGRPISGARVTSAGGGGSALTDESGSVLLKVGLSGAPASTVVSVEAEGFEPTQTRVTLPEPLTPTPVPVGVALVRKALPDDSVPSVSLRWRRIIAAVIGGALLAIPGTHGILRWIADTSIESLGDLLALLLLVTPIYLLLAAAAAVGIVQVLVERRRLAHGLIAFGLTPVAIIVAIIVLNAVFG